MVNKSLFKTVVSGLLIAAMCTSVTPLVSADEPALSAISVGAETATVENDANEVVLLFTNDVHNAYLSDDENGTLGYAGLATYKSLLEADGKTAVVLDGGDGLQGGPIGVLSNGAYIADMMDIVGYSYAAVGNHEFDFGVSNLLEIAGTHNYKYLSCNFIDLATGETVFEPYALVDYEDFTVAYVGITTPETFTKSTPTHFQNAEGEYIYGFCEGNDGADLYAAVQAAVDSAISEGADCVVALAHTGVDPSSTPWTSYEVIANTTNIDLYLDGHSHTVIEGELVLDAAGEEVILASTGTAFQNISEIILTSDGIKSVKLVNGITADNAEATEAINAITAQFIEAVNVKIGESEVTLITNDPTTGERLVRTAETNLGDFCADAYRHVLGADIGFANGGGLRSTLAIGDLSFNTLLSVYPFGNTACLVEATGQEIADALEHAYRFVGVGESGSFLQVSGVTLTIDTTIESSVVTDEKGMFVEVTGDRRVKDILINGEPIDLDGTYTVASHNYMLKNGGDGFGMFADNAVIMDEVMLDSEVLAAYIDLLGGTIAADSIYANLYGEGRITMISNEEAVVAGEAVIAGEAEEVAVVDEAEEIVVVIPSSNVMYTAHKALRINFSGWNFGYDGFE